MLEILWWWGRWEELDIVNACAREDWRLWSILMGDSEIFIFWSMFGNVVLELWD